MALHKLSNQKSQLLPFGFDLVVRDLRVANGIFQLLLLKVSGELGGLMLDDSFLLDELLLGIPELSGLMIGNYF